MEELWGKLTNLSYEVFGVFVPGGILLLMILLWWLAIGEIPLPSGHLKIDAKFIQGIPESLLSSAATIALIYFLGHLLVWVSRKTSGFDKRIIVRIAQSLRFRIPQSEAKFDESLRPMMLASAVRLGIPENDETWRRFYPIAKIVLAERLTKSLVSIYQNKYTLHRSITASAAILFWLTLVTLILGALRWFPSGVNWGGISCLFIASLILVWGFSASFAFYWKMWANAIITETYAVLAGATSR